MPKSAEFQPNWVSAPGETIADILEDRNLSVVEFAQRIDRTPEQVNELLQGRTSMTGEIARQLENILAAPLRFG